MEFYIVWVLLIVVCILEAITSEVYPPNFKNYEDKKRGKKNTGKRIS
jgi:hypothetical protein